MCLPSLQFQMYDVSYFEARGKHIPLGMYGGGEVEIHKPKKIEPILTQVLGDRRPAGPSSQQGLNTHPGERYSAGTEVPPQTSGSPPQTYKKPEVKSLGTPNQPTSPSTAIQLEACTKVQIQ